MHESWSSTYSRASCLCPCIQTLSVQTLASSCTGVSTAGLWVVRVQTMHAAARHCIVVLRWFPSPAAGCCWCPRQSAGRPGGVPPGAGAAGQHQVSTAAQCNLLHHQAGGTSMQDCTSSLRTHWQPTHMCSTVASMYCSSGERGSRPRLSLWVSYEEGIKLAALQYSHAVLTVPLWMLSTLMVLLLPCCCCRSSLRWSVCCRLLVLMCAPGSTT
jgi:hypothetical protein